MRLVRDQRNNLFHWTANTSCAITNESTDVLQSRHNRTQYLRFYVRSYPGGALEVSILVYDQGTCPDGD
jgi:hypothetical protein